MTTKTIKQDSVYILSSSNATVTFSSGTNIDVTTATDAGVYGGGATNWNVTNDGSISGSSALAFGGTGVVTIVNAVGGKISNTTGTYSCIYTKGAGKVTNDGKITGSGTGNGGPDGGISAIDLNGGGTITNASTGVIVGNVATAAGTINNAGSISNSGDELSGVYIGSSTSAVSNSGTINVSGQHASDIYSKVGGTVTNSGKLTGLASYMVGINMEDGGTATNSGSITLSSTQHIAGIKLVNAGSAINKGQITITVTTGHATGIELEFQGAAANSGTISVTGAHVQGIGLVNAGTANNSGKIEIDSSASVAVSYATGIYSGVNATITNSGKISLSGLAHLGGIVLENNGSVNNSGSIQVASSEGNAVGVKLVAGGSVTNSGSVVVTTPQLGAGVYLDGGTLDNLAGATISCAGLAGVYATGSGGDTITNAGKISGANSIVFANTGTDTQGSLNILTLETGSDLLGAVLGSTNAYVGNSLILEGHGTASNAFDNFQKLTVNTGAAWTLAGASEIASTYVNGSLTVSATGSLSGDLTLEAGSTAIFDSTYNQDIGFVGAAELELTQNDYTGQISGLGSGDKVDFLKLAYATGDMLALSGAQLNVETSKGKILGYLTLDSSDYGLSQFKIGEDAAGHILVKGQ